METSLLLIRHAETVWNREGRMQGFLDSPLSDTGLSQAEKLGRRLRSKKISAVYASDALRCVETARLALGHTGHAPTLMPALRERNLGDWEGRMWKDVADADPDAARTYKRDPSYRPPNGESWHELQARATAALREILAAHPGGRVAVVTSGGTLRAAVFGAMSSPPETWSFWATWNTGLSRLDHRDGVWKLVKYNDVGHLSGTGDGHAVF